MAILIAQLNQHQLTAYNQLYAEYKDNLRIHQRREQAINDISNYIVYTTLVAHLPLIDGFKIVYKWL